MKNSNGVNPCIFLNLSAMIGKLKAQRAKLKI